MLEKIIIAGMGGQGNLFLGKILCLAAIEEELNATWLPSYGPAMRGEKSTCAVVISDEEIGAPIIRVPDTLIIMNRVSLDFINDIERGLVIINQSLAKYNGVSNDDILIVKIKTKDIIKNLGNSQILNMILLGAYLKRRNIVKLESVIKVLKYDEKFFEINKKAVMAGYDYFEK